MNIKSVLFCRVSSKEQEETGYSLDSQERLLKTYASRKNFVVSKIFAISESAGGSKQREVFKKMVEYVQKQDIKIIVCEKVDRLTRNFKDAVWIDEWLEEDKDRAVHLVKDSLVLHKESRSQEKLNWGIRILFAKNYIDNLSEEVKKGYNEKIKQGWMPHVPPIGYITVGEKGKRIHIIDPDKANYIKQVFKLYVSENYSIEKLCVKMFDEGLRSKRGKRIVKPKMYAILTNPFYTGKFKWGDKIHQGKHEPLITEQTFQKVRSILSGKSATKTTKRNFLFKGMMRCSECTGMITWEEHKGFIYGHCNHYRKCSQKVWSKQPLVESQLELAFRKLQLDNPRIAKWILKALKESHKDEINYHTSRQNELNQRLKRVQRRIETLYDDKLDSVIDAEFFENKNSKLLVEKENVLNDIEKLSNTNDEYYQDSIDIYKLSQNAFETYKKANVDAKRNLLRLVFGKMLLNEGKLVYNYSKPFELLQKAVGTTNSSKIPESEFLKMNIFEQPKKSETMAITQGIYPQSYLVRE